MRILIVGYDPGQTSAIAVFDLKGNLLFKKSKTNFSETEIISILNKYGKPLIFATDKKEIPKAVERLANRYKAKIFNPREDLSIKQKQDLARRFDPSDTHERDSIAAAYFAYLSYKDLIEKIEKKLSELTLDNIFETIIKEELDISNAIKNFIFEELTDEQPKTNRIKSKASKHNNRNSLIEEYKRKIDYLIEENIKLKKLVEKLLENKKIEISLKISVSEKNENTKNEVKINKIVEEYREKRLKEFNL